MRRGLLLLGCLLLVSQLAIGQTAEWTIWELLSSESFPGKLVWMVDDSLFITLHNPNSLARFEPANNRLIVWELDVEPGEFVLTNVGLLFVASRDGKIGWLQPDANHVETWPLPQLGQEPMFVRRSSFGTGVENVWYLEWGLGRLGLFEPMQFPSSLQEGPPPVEISTSSTTQIAMASTQSVSPEVYPSNPNLVPAVYGIEPTRSGSFREWGLVTMDPPAYTFVEDNEGHVWVPNAIGQTLLRLNPAENLVTAYDLPSSLFVTSLAAVPDATDIYFVAREDDVRAVLGVLQPESGDVAMWPIPGGVELDAVSLIITDDALWFCDRGHSAVYRFIPMLGEFTWWTTGSVEDSPLYIEAGNSGEFWVSWEGTGKIARLSIGEQ